MGLNLKTRIFNHPVGNLKNNIAVYLKLVLNVPMDK